MNVARKRLRELAIIDPGPSYAFAEEAIDWLHRVPADALREVKADQPHLWNWYVDMRAFLDPDAKPLQKEPS